MQSELILGKYKKVKKLGKGAYGDVILVEDLTGNKYAIKMINKQLIQKDPYLQQYLDGECEVMTSLKNPNIVQLYFDEEDQNYRYFVCEYCDGGDLLNYQAKQPNKVFTLQKATYILSEIIRGLQYLHSKEYLHRDIKSQNILLKKISGKEGQYIFKLADFGFAKKRELGRDTILGTQYFMSPQIFSNQPYGYQVDMWAMGVLFYFMLNMEFPFKINPHGTFEQKRIQLIQQAKNFNYTEKVKKSGKKLMQNCIQQVNSFFSKIFNLNSQQRITFVQIRKQKLFKDYFPEEISTESLIVYSKHYSKKLKNRVKSNVDSEPSKSIQGSNIQGINPPLPAALKYSTQKYTLEVMLDRINFLGNIEQDLSKEIDFIRKEDSFPYRYNLLKLYIIFLRRFRQSLNISKLEQNYPHLSNWKIFLKTQDFSAFVQEIQKKTSAAELRLASCYKQCSSIAKFLGNQYSSFKACLSENVKETQIEGQFEISYRTSSEICYEIVRKKFPQGLRYVCATTLVVICHCFPYLIHCDEENLQQIFQQYYKERIGKGQLITFSGLKDWISTSSKQKLKNVIKSLLNTFFQRKG